MSKGLIADIERASTHDGYGMRTVVFFKGCPLSCLWCHNPECISPEKEMMFYPEKCIHCGRCAEGCYSGAKVICGKEYTPQELLTEIMQDYDYYGEKGGVTFSGGEPLAQKAFLKEIISLCREKKVGCAVETSLYIYDEDVFGSLDFIMADLKIWDDETHKKFTGVSNKIIKENFIKLNKLGIPIIARTPVIPEINQGIDKISEFLKGLNNVSEYELLPYHSLGISKSKALGKEYREFEVPSREYMKELEKYVFIR